jgi:hypothetical protein
MLSQSSASWFACLRHFRLSAAHGSGWGWDGFGLASAFFRFFRQLIYCTPFLEIGPHAPLSHVASPCYILYLYQNWR